MGQQSKILAAVAAVTALVICVGSANAAPQLSPSTPLNSEVEAAPTAEPTTPPEASPPPVEVKKGTSLTAPTSGQSTDKSGGGVTAESSKPEAESQSGGASVEAAPQEAGGTPTPPDLSGALGALAIPSLPDSNCASSGVPAVLVPIYRRASDAYGLGPRGPAILAGINEIETAFGTNLNVSSAGALGWMQFMPATWDAYGVDANGDGVKDPYNPEDAIFAAANYLRASGMPDDVYGAIFAYNHADWYVADVLANAGCYGSLGGATSSFSLAPQLPVISCQPADEFRKDIPAAYLHAFETAAARYDLGQRGVWALAAIARLESNFGRGMSRDEMKRFGPLGLDGIEWRHYSVDGNEDGRIRHASPADSAATLARLIWSRGSVDAGVFAHNQAQWYVDAVAHEADRLEGKCETTYVDWTLTLPADSLAPIQWSNLTLSNDLELADIENGVLDQRILALLGLMTKHHQITISSLRSDHSQMTASGNVSNHFFGRAMDIAAVDGVSCTDTAPSAPCAQLGYALAQMTEPLHPTELIYCFDLDGPGPAFALPDHCNHIHAGFDD